jgi:hypothetical protein
MTPLTEEAIALLQRAQFQIQNAPQRFDMSIWDTGKLVDIAGIIYRDQLEDAVAKVPKPNYSQGPAATAAASDSPAPRFG